jgi:hypothetical protein
MERRPAGGWVLDGPGGGCEGGALVHRAGSVGGEASTTGSGEVGHA